MYKNMSNPIMLELLKKHKRYQNMRDHELAEHNYSQAAVMNEIAKGIELSMQIVDQQLHSVNMFPDSFSEKNDIDRPKISEELETPEELESLEKENDFNSDISFEQPVSSLFSLGSVNSSNRSPINKIAAEIPPNDKYERASAIKTKLEQEIPEPYQEIEKKPELKKFIDNANEFFENVLKNKNKKSDINLDNILNVRERACAEEKKNMDESIGIPSYVVNEKYAFLQINDLGISLPKDTPLDLSKFSANKLFASKDLKTIINNQMIKFISPEEAKEIPKQHLEKNDDSEQKYGSYNAQDQSINKKPDVNTDEPYEIDLENDFDRSNHENSSGMLNLTPKNINGVKRTIHSNFQNNNLSDAQNNSNISAKKVHKSIKRIE